MNMQLRLPLPEPPDRSLVFHASPAEHQHLTKIWERQPDGEKAATMAKVHAWLAQRIQRHLEAGTARIEPSREAYAKAIAALAARGMF